MNLFKWLAATISLVLLIGLTVYVGATRAFFVDDEQSYNDALGFQWGLVVLNNDFEDSGWEDNWDENDTTSWTRSTDQAFAGSYSARSNAGEASYLTTDEIDAFEAASITIQFMYYPHNLETGDVILEAFNGTAYNTIIDLRNHANYVNDSWCNFSYAITDTEPEYFIPGFRLRFDSTAVSGDDIIYIDNISIITDSTPPGQPQGLTATRGDREVYVGWTANNETDLTGYIINRSTNGVNYSEIESLYTSTNYTDTDVINDTTYYYIINAIDLGSNISENSTPASATPTDLAPAAPQGLTATDGDTQVFLDWNDNDEYDFNHYDVFRSLTGGSGYAKINTVDLTESTYTDSGLTNDTTYYYIVTATDNTSNTSNNSTVAYATPTDQAPAIPTNLAATAGNRAIELNWADNTDYDLNSYNVYRSTTSGSGYARINTANVTTSNFTDTGLTGGTVYYYVVTAVDNTAHESGYSSEDGDTPYDDPPAAPQNLSAAQGDRLIDLSWDTVPEDDVDGYNIYRSTTSGTGYSKINTALVTSDSYLDTGLTGGVRYYYVVKAVDLIGQASVYSNETYATPSDNAPSAPQNLSASGSDRQAILDWDDNSENDLSGYNVFRSLTAGSGYTKINGSLVSTSNYTDTGLTGGTTYYYVVRAVDLASQSSPDSNTANATADDYDPSAPTGLSVEPDDATAILDWNDNTEDDLNGYNVYRSLSSGSGYAKVNGTLALTSNYTDTGLSGGVTYYYVVTAVDLGLNESVYSSENFTTPTDPPPSAPTGLVATPHDASVSLDWNDNTEGDLDGYYVYRKANGAPDYTKVNGLIYSSNYTDTGLTNGTLYRYVVTAVDITTSESVPSISVNATPNATPAAPQNPVATAGDRTIYLGWDPNGEGDIAGYNIYRSLTSGSGFTKINGSLETTSNYTDTGLDSTVTYYYVITTVDTIYNESVYSNEVSTNPNDYAPAYPTGLAATGGDRQVTLDWFDNIEDDLAYYNVYRSTTSGSGYVNVANTTSSSLTDTGLIGGTTYYYVVTAVDLLSQESSYSGEDSATVSDANPGAPVNLTATAGDKQISLNWNDNTEDDFDHYKVYHSLTSGSGYVNVANTTSSDYLNTSLIGGTTYYYVITAVDAAANEGSYSNEAYATAQDADPSAPTGLTATGADHQIVLDWSDNTENDIDGYNVYRSLSSGSGYTKLTTVSLAPSSTYTDTGLTPGITYYYVVTAVDLGENESTYSDEVDAIPSGPTVINDSFEGTPWYDNWDENGVTGWVLGATARTGSYSATSDKSNYGYLTSDNLYALVTTSISIDFWYYAGSLEAGDVLIQAYNGTAYNTLYDLTAYPGFTQNGWYEFTVTLTDSQYFIGEFHIRFVSAAAGNDVIRIDDVLLITDDLPPLIPSGLTATAGEEQVSLNWDDNSEVDLEGYNVYHSTTSGSGYTQINGSTLTSSSYVDTGRTNGTTYYYVVTAVDMGINESDYSNEASATPADVAPSAPTGLSATPGDEEVALDWNDNPEGDIAGYYIYRSTTSGYGHSKLNGGSTVSSSNYTDTTAEGGTTYYYYVTALDNTAHESSASTEISATPNDPPPAAPTGVTANATDRGSFIEWNVNTEDDINGYNVYRSLAGDSGYAKINTSLVGTVNYTDTGLTGGTMYYYIVTAVDLGSNESANSTWVSVTPYDNDPAAPTGLTANASDRQVSLDWNDNTDDDFDGYNVYRSTTSGSGYGKVNGSLISSSSYTDTGLTGGVTYYYVVTAVDLGSNEGAYSNEASAIPTDVPPAAPYLHTPALTGDAEVILEWTANTEDDLAGYNIYRSLSENGTYTKLNGSLVTAITYSDTGLTEGITYYYRVTAVDYGTHESDYSNTVATPLDWDPDAPAGLVATPHDAYVSLDWNDNSETDIEGYNLYRSTTSGTGYAILAANVSSSQYTDNTTSNEVTYFYVVTAVDFGEHESDYSNEDSATPNVTPPAPTGLSATAGDRQVGLSWTDTNTDNDTAGFNIYRSITSGEGYSKLNGSLITASNFTDSGLTAGITYYYVVTTVDTIFNESAISNEDSAEPYDAVPNAPTWISITGGDRQVSLAWNVNSENDIDGYDVYRSTTSGSGYVKINGSLIAGTTYTDTDVVGGTTYYYVLKAVDLAGQPSAYSTEDSAQPTDAAPSAPTGLAAAAGDKQVSLDWADNTEDDLNSYKVYRSISDNTSFVAIASNVTASQYTDTGLSGNVTYFYHVTAVDDASHESTASNEDSATPTDPAPAAPTGLAATPHDGQVSLDWNDNSEDDFNSYNVYRSTTSGTGYAKINGSGVMSSDYTDNTATNDTTYYYVVTAVDDASNESTISAEDSATPNATPNAPTGLIGTPGNSQVSLDWNDNPEGDIAGYNVYRSLVSGSGYSKINASIVESSTYTDTNLTNGTTYYYVVTAVDTIANESVYSTEESTTPVGVTLLNDGFEGSPWYGNWDNNGTTDWSAGTGYTGSVSAVHYSSDTYLTSDNLDTSTAGSITVTFWFKIKALNKGPFTIQIWNGTSYVDWVNLQATSGYIKNTWAQFSQTITDSQYFRSDFRIRFDGASLNTDAYIDDVLVVIN